MEDLIKTSTYSREIENQYGVTISSSFRGNKKWSLRMKSVFENQGKGWDDMLEKRVKRSVAVEAIKVGADSINAHRKAPIVALVRTLESYLNGIN